MARAKKEMALSPAGEVVGQTIEQIGSGWFQAALLIFTGGIMFTEGAEILVMGSITRLIKKEWHIDPTIRGAMVSVVFIGFATGNILAGQIGDRFGRRVAILIAYFMIGVMGFATGGVQGPILMLVFRYLVGVGAGIGFPSIYALLPECSPKRMRSTITLFMISCMPLGEFYAALLVLLIDPRLNNLTEGCGVGYYPGRGIVEPSACTWKALCELSAVPAAVFFVLALCFMHESPQWLASRGRYEETANVLCRMAQVNGKSLDREELLNKLHGRSAEDPNELDVAEQVEDFSWFTAVANLFCRSTLQTVAIYMCFAHFTKDFTMFGLGYALPQFFAFLKELDAGTELLIVACLSLPSLMIAYIATRMQDVSLTTWMSASGILCAIAAVGMLQATPMWLSSPCVYCVKILVLDYFIFTIIYTSQAFPTSVRTTATGCCTAAGRIGSITAPILIEVSKHMTGSFDVFTGCLMSFLVIVGLTAPHVLPKRALMDQESGTSSGKMKQDCFEKCCGERAELNYGLDATYGISKKL